MNKLSKEKRQKLLLVGLGTGAVLAVLYLVVITSQMGALDDYANKLDSAREKLTKAENWSRMAPGIVAKLEFNRNELETKQEGMAPVDKFKWFYNTLAKS